MLRNWKRLPLGLAAALLLAAGLPAQPPEVFTEKIVIREREILVDLPDNVADDRLAPGDFQVLVDGRPREVVRAEPAGREDAWTLVVYVDQVLASPETVFVSTLSLANRVGELTRLGPVEVVVAASDPVTALASTRDTRQLSQTLTDLAGRARVVRDAETALGRPQPTPLQLRRQTEKLLAFLADHRPAGPHALFLVMDGIALPPEQLSRLETLQRTARLLAGYGWVTVPLALRKDDAGPEVAPQREVEIFRQSSAPSKHQSGVPPMLPGRPPGKSTLAFPKVVDFLLAPETLALRALAQPTSGVIVGYEVQLDALLQALPRRWRIWVTEPDWPVDGQLHTLTVSLPRKRKEARAPGWLRSSTPAAVAGLRLENLLAGRSMGGDLPLTIAVQRGAAGSELRVKIAPFPLPDSAPPGPVRISYAFPGEDGATTSRQEVFLAGDLERQGWQRTVRIDPPPGAQRVAVVVEALGPEKWGGAVVEIAAPSPP